MKASFVAEMTKFGVACIGPALVLFHIYLFKSYFELGSPSPDDIHSVPLNNHGVYRYITESQSQILDLSLGAAVVMLLVFFGMIIMKLRRR